MKMSSDTQKNMSVAIKKIKEESKKKAKVIFARKKNILILI